MTAEEYAVAMEIQDQQRRLGVRVQSVDEICGKVARRPPIATRPSDRYIRQPAAPSKAPAQVANIVPFVQQTSLLGAVMKSNLTLSLDARPAVFEAFADATKAQRMAAFGVFMAFAESLPIDSPTVPRTAAEVADELGFSASDVGRILTKLEAADLIRRTRGAHRRGNVLQVHVNPRYAFRGRSANFGACADAYAAIGSVDPAIAP